MLINEGLILEKYQEMKNLNITENFLDEARFGAIKIFINVKPAMCLFKIVFDDTDIVYVGSN